MGRTGVRRKGIARRIGQLAGPDEVTDLGAGAHVGVWAGRTTTVTQHATPARPPRRSPTKGAAPRGGAMILVSGSRASSAAAPAGSRRDCAILAADAVTAPPAPCSRTSPRDGQHLWTAAAGVERGRLPPPRCFRLPAASGYPAGPLPAGVCAALGACPARARADTHEHPGGRSAGGVPPRYTRSPEDVPHGCAAGRRACLRRERQSAQPSLSTSWSAVRPSLMSSRISSAVSA